MIDAHEPSTRRGYDRWSATYDGDGNPLVALEERELGDLLGPVEGLAVLDLGTGTGRAALRLAEAGAFVTAVDFSSGMLARARSKPRAERVRFVRADLGAALPFRPAGFDRVLACLVLDHLPALGVLFAQAARALRPGGALVATVMHPAMNLRGSQARFVDERTGERVHGASERHVTVDYLNAAAAAGLRLERAVEAAPDAALAARFPRAGKYVGWPMLLGMRLSAA